MTGRHRGDDDPIDPSLRRDIIAVAILIATAVAACVAMAVTLI